MNVRRNHRFLALGAALALALTACGGDTTADDPSPDGGDTGTGDATDDGGGDGEPIRIGVLTSLTGPFAPWGLQAEAGMQMAADEINAQGGVDGRQIELVPADDQNNPEEGVTAFERMIEQDGVVAAGGMISSDVGLATARVAEELEVPLFLVKSGAASILTQDSRHTFRTCLAAAPMVVQPYVQYIQQEGMTRVGAIIADYAWGQSILDALEAQFAELDDVEIQIEVAPVGETDFSTYLRSLEGLDPEIIIATGHPPGSGSITLQATDQGFDVPVTGPDGPLVSVMEGIGEAAHDRYTDYDCANFEDEEYIELATRFAESSDLGFMDDDAVAGYGIVTMVAEAVAEVGDDPAAISEYLHANEFDLPGYSFTMAWTEWGELAQAQPVISIIRGQEPPEGVNPGADWYPEVLIVSEPLEPHVPE